MAYLPDYDYDVFISFSHGDNSLLPGTSDPKIHGWVKRFAAQLETWLRDQRGLEGLKVWLDLDRLGGNTVFDERISKDLGRTAILLVLHSHNYRKSDYCRQELAWFLDAAGKQGAGLEPGGERRVFNVLINNIHHAHWDDKALWERAFKGTPGFRFNDAAGNDRGAFGDPLSETDAGPYRDALKPIVDAAYRMLSTFPPPAAAEPEPPPPDAGGADDQRPLVLIADCPDTQMALRDRLIEELKPLVRLAPPIPPPWPAVEHDATARQALSQAALSIHLLDGFAGRRMDGGTQSYVRSQAQLAMDADSHAMLWLPDGLDLDQIADADHKAWLDALQTERRDGTRFELLRGTPTQLVNDVREQIQALSQRLAGDHRQRTLVVDPHQLDQLAGLELGYRLNQRAPNVRLLMTRDGAEPAERWTDFEDLVVKAEELVVVFGRVAPQWVASRIERAFKVAAEHFGDGLALRKIWVLLLPDSPGLEAVPGLPPFASALVDALDNRAATQISDAVIERILDDGGAS